MDTFNRLIRKVPPPESTPFVDEDCEMNFGPQDEDLGVAATANELQSPFNPPSIPAHVSSQKRSALPPGAANQVGAVLTFRRSRSPERHGTLQVNEVSSFDRVVYRSLLNALKQLIQKVRVVGRQDPRQALQLEELEAQASKSEIPE